MAGSNIRQVSFPLVQSIRKIGVIGNVPLKPELISGLFQQNLEINLLELKNERRIKGDNSQSIFVSDLNFWGIPPKHLIQSFVDTPFDILINFATTPTEVADYICAVSVARFKAAKYQRQMLYDLVINQQSISDSDFLKEIIKTLNNFSN